MSVLLLMRLGSYFLGGKAFVFQAELYGGLLMFIGYVLFDTQVLCFAMRLDSMQVLHLLLRFEYLKWLEAKLKLLLIYIRYVVSDTQVLGLPCCLTGYSSRQGRQTCIMRHHLRFCLQMMPFNPA